MVRALLLLSRTSSEDAVAGSSAEVSSRWDSPRSHAHFAGLRMPLTAALQPETPLQPAEEADLIISRRDPMARASGGPSAGDSGRLDETMPQARDTAHHCFEPYYPPAGSADGCCNGLTKCNYSDRSANA